MYFTSLLYLVLWKKLTLQDPLTPNASPLVYVVEESYQYVE